MRRIGILSDTHSVVLDKVYEFFSGCDEIWHAGDIGTQETADRLEKFKPLRAVYGNIDDHRIRLRYPEHLSFAYEGVRVLMLHIGGYPGHYNRKAKNLILQEKPGLVITGHSHILKVMYDPSLAHLHINPGAAGPYGFHNSITLVRLVFDEGKMKDLEVLDLPRKS